MSMPAYCLAAIGEWLDSYVFWLAFIDEQRIGRRVKRQIVVAI